MTHARFAPPKRTWLSSNGRPARSTVSLKPWSRQQQVDLHEVGIHHDHALSQGATHGIEVSALLQKATELAGFGTDLASLPQPIRHRGGDHARQAGQFVVLEIAEEAHECQGVDGFVQPGPDCSID